MNMTILVRLSSLYGVSGRALAGSTPLHNDQRQVRRNADSIETHAYGGVFQMLKVRASTLRLRKCR